MSIPEVFVLVFIISLWVLSIVCCYKRYEKITKLERADMPTFQKQNINNESIDTASSLSSKNNTTNSTNNLNTSLNCSPSIANFSTSQNKPLLLHDTNTHSTSSPIVCNFLYHENQPPKPLVNTSLDETSSVNNISKTTNTHFRYEIVAYEKTKYQKYKKNQIVNQMHNHLQNTATPHHHTNNHYHKNHYRANGSSYQIKQQKLDEEQEDEKKNSDTCFRRISQDGYLLKSNSEPAFKELIDEINRAKTSAPVKDDEPLLLRASSIEDDNCLNSPAVVTSHNSYQITNFPEKMYQKNESKAKKKRQGLTYNNKSFNDNNLLDPHLIPKVIQKSLIDLHKKSMWNLAHKPANCAKNTNQQLVSSSASNNQLVSITNMNNSLGVNGKCCSGQQGDSCYSNATVYTQQRHRNEIKMKIIDNYV